MTNSPKTFAEALEAFSTSQSIERPREAFDKLQDEIIALSVFASAARRAQIAEFQKHGFEPRRDPVLLGYDWEPLAATAFARIAKLADELTYVAYYLPTGDEPAQPGDQVGGGTAL